MVNQGFDLRSFRDVAMIFWRRIDHNGHSPVPFFAVAFYNRWKDRNTDGRINANDDPLRKNW